ncbi:hypothetical protein HPP92_024122 [Vanilla planifolia]|uniref:Cytochrome b5 heme-binding domain-containing protein n=1 Tax=Vanilla planifolia TaxID=51239 RepID=A0A835PLW0_VANPL|nr:hypothetical protein HPP92_024122 [Vanilla planifolia]
MKGATATDYMAFEEKRTLIKMLVVFRYFSHLAKKMIKSTAVKYINARGASLADIQQKNKGTEQKKYITLEELQQRSYRSDLWISVDGKVYDVTKWIDNLAGQEAIDPFLVFQPPSSRKLFDRFLAGQVEERDLAAGMIVDPFGDVVHLAVHEDLQIGTIAVLLELLQGDVLLLPGFHVLLLGSHVLLLDVS